MKTTTAMMLGAAMKGRGGAKRDRPERYRIARSIVWLVDHLLVTAFAVMLVLLQLVGAPAWLEVLVLGGIVAMNFVPVVRRWLDERMSTRRVMRSWGGNPWTASIAESLGLTCKGFAPGIMDARFVDGAEGSRDRVMKFGMVAGVTPSMFEGSREALMGAFGVVGLKIESPHPSVVTLRLYDSVLPLEPTRNADWADAADPDAEDSPVVGLRKPPAAQSAPAWWKAADEDGEQ